MKKAKIALIMSASCLLALGMSYGPYKLTHFEAGKKITIERNPEWYGYSDGNHVGQFKMTGINTTIIKDHADVLQPKFQCLFCFERENLLG